MRLAAPLVLLALLLAGCASTPAPTVPPANDTVMEPPTQVDFQNGTSLPEPAAAMPAKVTLFSTGKQGGEPSMGITPKGTVLAMAYEQTMRSRDAGKTWDDAYDYSTYYAGADQHLLGSNDPYVHVDTRTGRIFVDHMESLTCTNLLWSDDEGATWAKHDQACGTPLVDFPKVITAKPGPKAAPVAGLRYPDVVYLCYNKGVFTGVAAYSSTCTMSYDGGTTFPLERQALAYAFVPGANQFVGQCAGGATFADAPDGTVLAIACGGFSMARTQDSGVTWDPVAPPKDAAATLGASVAFASYGDDGTLYLLGVSQKDGRAYLHVSTDGGSSWGAGIAVSPPGVAPVSFPTLVAGAKGRVAMAFLGARTNATDPEKVPDDARWATWIATLDDALSPAPIVHATQATPRDDPVQVGPICLGGASCRGARNLGDFIGSARAADGTFWVTYADGCVDACAAQPASKESRSAMTMVARLDGWSLSPGSGTP